MANKCLNICDLKLWLLKFIKLNFYIFIPGNIGDFKDQLLRFKFSVPLILPFLNNYTGISKPHNADLSLVL